MKQPRYTKAGTIYKADRDYLAEGWPETIPPGSDPADLHQAPGVPEKATGAAAIPLKKKGNL